MDFQYFPLLVWTICILSGPSVQELLFFGIFCQILWGSFVIYNGPTLQELLNLALFCQIVWGSILLQGWSFKIPHLQYCRRGILNVQPCIFDFQKLLLAKSKPNWCRAGTEPKFSKLNRAWAYWYLPLPSPTFPYLPLPSPTFSYHPPPLLLPPPSPKNFIQKMPPLPSSSDYWMYISWSARPSGPLGA